ncbi:MAG: hypothetical protein MJ102_01960 [Clostridia bacterium]|nr:hypothetical protein [Clostridia bacterium]
MERKKNDKGNNTKKTVLKSPRHLIVPVSAGVLITVIIAAVKGLFSARSTAAAILAMSDGAFVSGLILAAAGLLLLSLSNETSSTLKCFVLNIGKKGKGHDNSKKKNLTAEDRIPCRYTFIAAAIFAAAGIILAVVY